jgi:hypothetical protein
MRIIYTHHAQQRMKQRKVTHEQVELTLAEPDEIQPGDNGGDIVVKNFGDREVQVVYEAIDADTYLIFTVMKPRVHGS